VTDLVTNPRNAQRSQLLARLLSLRGKIRRRLVLYGVCAVAAGGVVAFLTIVALDWLLWLPPALRLFGGVCFLAGFVASTYHWIVKPLSAQVGLEEIADRVERHFGTFDDRLASAVSFLGDEDTAGSPLARRVIEETERSVGDYPLESILSRAPLVRQLVWFALSAAVFAMLLVAAGDWVRIGFYRYVYPTGEIEWPRTVSIVPLTRDQAVAIGESVTVRMEVNRGLTGALRGEVHLREPDGRSWTQAMQRDREGTFYATIDAVTEDLRYWFVAGDDTTVRAPFTIRVVRRPEVVEVLATVEPPDYATERPPRVLDLSGGEIEASLGASVRIDITASKPIASGSTTGDPARAAGGDAPIALVVDPDDPMRLVGRLVVSGTVAFQIKLRDHDGMESRGAMRYVIRGVADAPPVVTVIEPQSLVELTPLGTVRLDVRVSDDFGVSSLELRRDKSGEALPPESLDSALTMTSDDDGVTAAATYDWSMQQSDAAPGDVFVYTLVARDNYRALDSLGQMGRSSPQRIRVISLSEFGVRLRSDLSHVETRIRQVALEQAEALDRSHAVTDESALSDEQRRVRLSDDASTQANLVRRTRELARRVMELVERIERNDRADEETNKRVSQVAQTLDATAGGPMSRAASALVDAAEQPRQEAPSPRLERAAESQEEAVERLHGLLRSMGQWGQFQGLVAKTRGLLERQHALRTETADLGREMLGKKVDALSPEQAARLKRVERKQKQLAEDVAQALQRMNELRERESEEDPVGAEALARALRSARAHDMTRHLDSASDALRENRTAAASIAQKSAAEALRHVLKSLEQREDRALAELRKQLRELAAQLALLIDDEQSLRDATNEAAMLEADDEAIDTLEREQRRLRRNSLSLADELGGNVEHVAMARLVRQAGRAMQVAERALTERSPAEAVADQDEALERLRAALERLEARADEVDDEIRRRSLAQIQEQLAEIREAQATVDEGVRELHGFVAEHGRLGRAQARIASRLTRTQVGVRAQVDVVMPDLEQVVVFRFAMNRVASDMDEVRMSLQRREIDDALVERSADILAQLDLLIQAAIDTADLPMEEQFVEGARGGGGRQQRSMPGKPVPTLTELLVLKAIQVDINSRTKALDESVDLTRPAEAELRALKKLGRDQQEVLRLTNLLTKQARQHP